MFSIFSRRAPKRSASAPRTPDGERIYAIGDIHGRFDLLRAAADKIAADSASAAGLTTRTILLGDYVDRGPRSADVLEYLQSGAFPTSTLALRGNHEEVFLQFLSDESILESWRKFGGLETLHSYGVPVNAAMRGEGYAEARNALLERLPKAHVDFLAATRPSAIAGDYFFCHAGVRPGVPLEHQTSDDLLWIRNEFLRHEGGYGKIVVHGHTPVEKPEMRANRINLDTGAYVSSRLTVLALEGETRRFL